MKHRLRPVFALTAVLAVIVGACSTPAATTAPTAAPTAAPSAARHRCSHGCGDRSPQRRRHGRPDGGPHRRADRGSDGRPDRGSAGQRGHAPGAPLSGVHVLRSVERERHGRRLDRRWRSSGTRSPSTTIRATSSTAWPSRSRRARTRRPTRSSSAKASPGATARRSPSDDVLFTWKIQRQPEPVLQQRPLGRGRRPRGVGRGGDFSADIEGITAPDPLTVEFKLKGPNGAFLSTLLNFRNYILPKKQILAAAPNIHTLDQKDIWALPYWQAPDVAIGPYKWAQDRGRPVHRVRREPDLLAGRAALREDPAVPDPGLRGRGRAAPVG